MFHVCCVGLNVCLVAVLYPSFIVVLYKFFKAYWFVSVFMLLFYIVSYVLVLLYCILLYFMYFFGFLYILLYCVSM